MIVLHEESKLIFDLLSGQLKLHIGVCCQISLYIMYRHKKWSHFALPRPKVTNFEVLKKKNPRRSYSTRIFSYPDPGSNRDGLPHWCLRPARLPIPPSGQLLFLNCECKGNDFFYMCKGNCIFFEKKFQILVYYTKKK